MIAFDETEARKYLELLRRGAAGTVTIKMLILKMLAADEKFRDELLATLDLGLVNGKLQELEDRVANLENRQQE